MHALDASLATFQGYVSSIDPYCVYLEDMPEKIRWNPFFEHSFDFSVASGKFKSVLIFLAVFLILFTYLHYHEMHAQAHDKLL